MSVQGAEQVLRPPSDGLRHLRGEQLEAQTLEPGDLAFRDGVIAALDADELAELTVDASGCAVIPGFVDCHTHLPFAGWRAGEYERKLRGVPYEEIARSGGGIAASARALRESSDDAVLAQSARLAAEMLATGTTTFECKSGYGLSRDGEMRALVLARELEIQVPQTTVSTALLAHAVPPGYTAEEWMAVVQEMMPEVLRAGSVTALDIFVESIAFTNDHLELMGELAASAGLALRCHAEQFASHHTVPVALAAGARSVDHLSMIDAGDIPALAAAACAAVLLPAAEFLGAEHRAPARALIESGAIVVLATDLNPGTAPVASMPVVLGLAARLYGLSVREALAAATLNAAWTLGLEHDRGSIEVGKRADVLVLDGPVEMLAYRFARNPVALRVRRRRAGVRAGRGGGREAGLVVRTAHIPAMANAHSHAFQLDLRGAGERLSPGDDFWSWRTEMYRLAGGHDPESMHAVGLRVYRQMAAAGYGAVGEFHYVHHQPDGTPYPEPNAMAIALAQAATACGLEITLLPAAYHRGGWAGSDSPPDPGQMRFCDPSVDAFLERVDGLREWARGRDGVTVGVAAHSVRAVPAGWLARIARYADDHGLVRHVHAAEQRRELAECYDEHRCSPIELLDRTGFLGPRTSVVHAIHVSEHDIELLAGADAVVVTCPTTEGNLGDGFLPGLRYRDAGVRLAIGTDEQVRIDPFEELREMETLARREGHTRFALLAAAGGDLWSQVTANGRASLGLTGEPAAIELDLDHPDLAGVAEADLMLAVATCASAGVVRAGVGG